MTMSYNFGVLILTHGRPQKVMTITTLRRQGYTGNIYLIVDNEDETVTEYQRLHENVIVFDKQDIANRYDTGDNFTERRTIFFARNASFEIARNLGLEYFLQLDDDFSGFYYRFDEQLNRLTTIRLVNQLDKVFESMLKYLINSNATTIAFAQGGDLIGGYGNRYLKTIMLKRKAMATFFCAVKKPFDYMGKINEDVNTYVTLGNRGHLIMTTFLININTTQTQKSSGGMTELYLSLGTYVKTFYSLMYAPSCVTLALMGTAHRRLHHKINWGNAVPKIIDQRHVKRLRESL